MTDNQSASLTHQAARLSPTSASRTKTGTYLFTYQFNAPTQATALGSMYIIIEMPTALPELRKLCDIITETIGHNYYNQAAVKQPAEHFENALAIVNKQLAAISDPQVAQYLHGMSACVAIVTPALIMFARAGNANAYLLRKAQLQAIFTPQQKKEQTKKTGFVDFAFGELKDADKILLISPAIAIALEQTEISASLNQTSAPLIIQNLHKLLASKPDPERQAVFAITVQTKSAATETPLTKAPAVIHTTKQLPFHKKIQTSARPLAVSAITKTKQQAKLTSSKLKETMLPKIVQASKQAWTKLWSRYINKNPRLYAAIGICCVIAIIVLVVTVIRPKNSLDANLSAYRAVDTAYLSAQAKYAEGDKPTATQLLANVSDQLNTLKAIKNYTKLDRQVQSDSSIIEKLPTTRLIAVVLDLNDKLTNTVRVHGDILTSAAHKLVTVTLSGQTIYSLSIDGTLLSYDTTTKQTHATSTKIPADHVIATTLDTSLNRLYFLTSDATVWQYDSTNATATQLRLSSGEWPSAVAMVYYNGAIYLASNDSYQITKHFPTSIGFGPGVPYFKVNQSNLLMSALAINGNIFVADKSGAISLFNLGIKQDFTVTGYPKSLGYAVELHVSTAPSQLSGLNNSHNRIFTLSVSDKSAVFINQYAITNAATVSSFDTGGSQSTYYLTSDNKLMSFKAR